MGGGQETREAVMNMHPKQAHMGEEQGSKLVFFMKVDKKPAGECFDMGLNTAPRQFALQFRHQLACALRQAGLQAFAALQHMVKHRVGGGQHQRMAHKGSGEEGRRGFRGAVVAIAPDAAIQRIHEAGLAAQYANRHTAADHLAVGGEVGAHVKQLLQTARMAAKAGDHLVDDKGGFAGFGDRPQLLQIVARLEIGMAALHRLDHDGGQQLAMLAQP